MFLGPRDDGDFNKTAEGVQDFAAVVKNDDDVFATTGQSFKTDSY